jgi:malonyl CoA-acyl carrier protein transacylase
MSNNRISIAEYAITQLSLFRDMTSMMIGANDDVNAASAYMHGLSVGIACFGIRPKLEHIRAAVQSRGWTWSASAPVPEMRVRLMLDTEIVRELIEIEILCWELYCKDLRSSED